MTKTAKVWAGVLASLLALVAVLLIVLMVQIGNAERDRKEAECREQSTSLVDRFLCEEHID